MGSLGNKTLIFIVAAFLFTLVSIGLSESISPRWQNQGQNASFAIKGKAILLYAQGYDNETGLRYAWLETNETGVWENKTIYYSNRFNDSSTVKNVTFDTFSNKTVYIELPKYSNVLDAKLNLNGSAFWGRKYNDSDANYACDGVYVEMTCIGAVDENILTGARCRPKSEVAGNVCNIYENYTVPPGAMNVTMSARFRPTTGNISFWYWNYTNNSWTNIEPSRCWPYADYITKTYNIPADGITPGYVNNSFLNNSLIMFRTRLGDCASAVVRTNETWIGWIDGYAKVIEDRDTSYSCDGVYVEMTCIGAVDENILTGARCRPKSEVAGNVCNIYENYTVPPNAVNLTISARFRPTTGNISFWYWNYTNNSWKNIEPSRCWPYADYITKTYNISSDGLNNLTGNSTLMFRTRLGDCASAVVRINETWITYYVRNPPDFWPNNTYLDVSGDGDTEWNYSSKFNITERTQDFSKEMNDYLSTCTPNVNGTCKVPLVFHSDNAGLIELSQLNVTYISGNYTTGFSNIKNQWLWSNFTWKNGSIPAVTAISWRIHYQDAGGNRNTTEIMTFHVDNAPIWQKQGQNSSVIFREDTLLLYAQGFDNDFGLRYAWLETNETGKWENKDAYGSPKELTTWWNSDWDYKRQIIVAENSGHNVIDYPINSTINTQEIIAAGKMNSDCSDMRIVNEASNSILDFGINDCNNVNSTIAFKTNLSAFQTLTDIYIYYGNPSAIPVNISFNDAYYELWDDFNTDSSSWDTSKWKQDKEYPSGCGGANRAGGTGRLWGCSNGWSYSVWSIQNFSANEGYYLTGRMNYDYSHCFPYAWLANATMVNNTDQTGGSRNNQLNSSFTMMVGSEDLRFAKYATVLNNTQYGFSFAQWEAEPSWSGLSPDWRDFNFTFNPYDDEIDVCWNIAFGKTPVCGKAVNNISAHMSDTKELKFSIACGYECTAYFSGKIEEFDDLFLRKWLPSEPSYSVGSEETVSEGWIWSNFTWKNNSVPVGTRVAWRIHYNDTFGAENVTNTMSFNVGNCLSSPDCDDSNECTENVCNATYQCVYPNKSQGTQCGLARDCPSDACNGFLGEFYPDDGHDTCDGSGNCIEYSCALENSYCTDDNPLDGINSLECGASCDQNEDCGNKCVGEIRYYSGNCNSTCDCSYSTEDCNLQDDCYIYDTGCENRNYSCVSGNCDYTYSDRNTDYNDSFVNYCFADTIRRHKQMHDFYCNDDCIDHVSWVDDELVEDCNLRDDWYDTFDIQWIELDQCNEKEQVQQEYRDYTCGEIPSVDCYYSVTGYQWVDTGNTRNKEDGTLCEDGLYCTINDVCTLGICDGSARDCTMNDISGIATCDWIPDDYHPTWDYRAEFLSQCDEINDLCTTGDLTITHVCADDNLTDDVPLGGCGAVCDENSDCPSNICKNDCTCKPIPGDVDGDCAVNILDLILLGNAYGSIPGKPNWDVRADLKEDSIINIFDLSTIGKNYGEMCPE